MLSDCVSQNRLADELFIVRPGRSYTIAKSVRDRITQAVLPIGKTIVKAKDARLDEVLDNEEFQCLVASLGVGICIARSEESDRLFNLDRIRYGKIILVTDETPTGRYIHEQVVSLMFRFFLPVLKAGYVYTSPLGPLARNDAAEFERTIISPATRTLIPVTAGSQRSKGAK